MEIMSNSASTAGRKIATMASTAPVTNPSASPASSQALLDVLPPGVDPGGAEMALRSSLRAGLSSMSSAQHDELVSALQVLATEGPDPEMTKVIERGLARKSMEPEKSGGIAQLVDLLYSLILLMAQATGLRRRASSKMGVMYVEQARLSGKKGIQGAALGLAGGVAGLAASAALTGYSMKKTFRTANHQISNLRENSAGARRLTQDAAQARAALERRLHPDLNAGTKSLSETLRASGRSVRLSPDDAPLERSAQTTLSQSVVHTEELAHARELRFQENQFRYGAHQQGAAALGQHGFILSSVIQASGSVGAAAKASDGKLADVEGSLAQASQHDASQQAMRYDEQKRDLFSLIRTLQEGHFNTVSSISGAMRA